MSTTISAGENHTLVVDQEGRVWSFGDNEDGQLGLGDNNEHIRPTRIKGLSGIISVSAGANYSLALDREGRVWSFGYNGYGQLGLGDTINRNIPTLIKELPFIVSISTGARHNLLLDQDGNVWSFGANSYGQLGLGNNLHQNKPSRIEDLSSIISISAGGVHNLALDRDGQVWSFGRNKFGQLGLGAPSSNSPNTASGVRGGLGDNFDRYRPTPIKDLPFITSISAGGEHSLILDQKGQIWSFGNDRNSQLGLGNSDTNSDSMQHSIPTRVNGIPFIISVSAGGNYNLVIDRRGQVWSFGNNDYGQLGLGDYVNRNVPTLIESLSFVVNISAGTFHSLALDRNGKVRSFGDNEYRQLGLGEEDNYGDRDLPVTIPNLIAQVPPDNSPNFVLTVFPLMEPYLDQMTDARINSYQGEDTVMELDLDGTTYLARLQYDSAKDSFDEPLVSEEEHYINLFNELLQNNGLKSSAYRPDFYLDEEGNEALEFEDWRGQRYLIRVHQ